MSKSTAAARPRRTSRSARKKTTTVRKPVQKPKLRRKSFPNYQAALRCLHDRVDFERSRAVRLQPDVFKLDRMKALMAALGNPQDSVRFVHVAGTKGKGSVCAMTAAALEACGYAVGLYTSPHLVDVRERVQINGHMIPFAAFTNIMGRCAAADEAVSARHGKSTFFEMITAVALCWFADQAVDVAVLEVGLGGRLDATNVVKPDVAAVASISLDHVQLLGATLPEIAKEKAGIFKPGVPALTIQQEPGVAEAMSQIAEKVGASFEVVGKDIDFSYRFEATPSLGPHTCVCLSTDKSNFEHVNVPLPGEHQALNCGLALAILDKLRQRGFDLPETTAIEGLANTRLPGRMELAWTEPRILLDGAHNASSLQALVRSIGAHVPYDSMVMVFGCCEDKDVDELLRRISLGADKLIFTRTRATPRAIDPRELQRRFTELSGKMTQVADSLPEALMLASRAVGRDDLICVTGSFYLVGEAKKHLAELASKKKAAAKH